MATSLGTTCLVCDYFLLSLNFFRVFRFVTVCEGTIITTSKHGMFTSHDQELYDTYPPNKECTIIISGDRPDEQVYINFFQNDLSPREYG